MIVWLPRRAATDKGGGAEEEGGEKAMTARVFRWAAIILNACAAFYWFSYALAWGPNDYIGGTIAATPPILAVVALVWARAPERRVGL
jgi:hypothetical protein